MRVRGFILECFFRIALISAAFLIGFSDLAKAQQQTPAPASSSPRNSAATPASPCDLTARS